MITIRHSRADGTLIEGSRRGDGVYEIARANGFTYFPSLGMIGIRGSRDKPAQTTRINAAADALRAAGHEVTVDVDDTPRPVAEVEADRADRAAGRADRLDERAGLAAGRGAARQAAAESVLDRIPFGQPMLVDHYSYTGDRNRRERACANMSKAITEGRYAAELAGRADAVRANEDAKDNPRAIMRRVERLQADLRRWQRELAEAQAGAASDTYRARVQSEIDQLTEDIAHQEAKLADRSASGEFVAWGPNNLAKGDLVQVGGHGWYRVTRVNRKTVSLDSDRWPQKAPFDEIFGRRRDGIQYDTPNGEPWPVTLAIAVTRWGQLVRDGRASGYDRDQVVRARHVAYAQRLVHGLDLSAADAEVVAFAPDDGDTTARRELAAACLSVYDRLAAGEPAPDIAATLTPQGRPTWRLPDTAPQDRRACPGWPHVEGQQFVAAGDLIAWVWDRSSHGRIPWRGFVGPVADVSAPKDRSERGVWVTITLADGTARDFETAQWLAVYPAGTVNPQGCES